MSFVLLLCFMADGHVDAFYVRMATPTQKSLILGTSRAAQGLQPRVFKEELNQEIFNFAFTVSHSPFGKVYYEAIQKKHLREEEGLFVIAVDPWSLVSWCEDPNAVEDFRENILCLHRTRNVTAHPNWHYLYDNFSGKLKDLVPYLNRDGMYLHPDGWLEIDIPMDSASVALRTKKKLTVYRNENLPKVKFSTLRLSYLEKTIEYLKPFGPVYLVRLPVCREFTVMEEELMPDFDLKIKAAITASNGYLNLSEQGDDYQYTDGNHLHKDSGMRVSKLIAQWIKAQPQQP
ncbi:MAG: hypothetical protein ACFB10_06125 [Salibacteraceae bacterium]